jgi:glycerophosphoryl diester phosphodiesterase
MVEVAGHRGAAGLAPENTLPSFRKALELGVRWIELDVRLTRDGRLVCFHDDRLDRLTADTGRLAEKAWSELRELPVLPGAFEGAYPEARIPLLEEVFAELPGSTHFLVELKPEVERAEKLVTDTLALIGGEARRCRFISFDQNLVRLVRAAGDYRTGVLTNPRDAAELLPRAREVKAVSLQAHQSVVTPDLLALAGAAGFRVNAWTVNTSDDARRLAQLGVDEITTDYPDVVLETLRGL